MGRQSFSAFAELAMIGFGFQRRLISLSKPNKRALLVCFDFFALSLALWASFSLRYERWEAPIAVDEWFIIASAPIVAIPVFIRMGLYRAVLRYLPEKAIWDNVPGYGHCYPQCGLCLPFCFHLPVLV
jgi:hypothetical protein